MERETGIEPALVAWKATVLPLNYSRPGVLLLWFVIPAKARIRFLLRNDDMKLVEGGGFEPPKA